MDALATEKFRIITNASPSCVWEAITKTGERVEHLYGLAVHSTWQPGATLTVGTAGGERLTGRVLRADPPRRLSYTLGTNPDDPSVYVTWDIDPQPDNTIMRLYIDEPTPADGSDIELAWTPVLMALERQLQACDHTTTAVRQSEARPTLQTDRPKPRAAPNEIENHDPTHPPT